MEHHDHFPIATHPRQLHRGTENVLVIFWTYFMCIQMKLFQNYFSRCNKKHYCWFTDYWNSEWFDGLQPICRTLTTLYRFTWCIPCIYLYFTQRRFQCRVLELQINIAYHIYAGALPQLCNIDPIVLWSCRSIICTTKRSWISGSS